MSEQSTGKKKRDKPAFGRTQQKSFFPQERYDGETYYDKPAVKPSPYGWMVVVYFFVGGLAGAAQILATIGDLFGGEGEEGLVKRGRFLALLGTLLSPVLLIGDLHVPQRFYNILRAFRGTSPMSIGSYVLSGFGLFSGVTAVAGWLEWKRLAKVAQIPAAVGGIGMSIYTGVLLSATSTPLWAALPKRLPALFGLSAASTAVAAISLGEKKSRRKMDLLGLMLAVAELGLSYEMKNELAKREVEGVLKEEPFKTVERYGITGVGLILPVMVRFLNLLIGGRLNFLSQLGNVGTLVGGLLLRALFVFAGNESAKRPQDTFRLAQPEEDGRG